jgi:hypothetical protein
MVAGARYAAEKKTPGRVLEFDFGREGLRITAQRGAEIAITSAAA